MTTLADVYDFAHSKMTERIAAYVADRNSLYLLEADGFRLVAEPFPSRAEAIEFARENYTREPLFLVEHSFGTPALTTVDGERLLSKGVRVTLRPQAGSPIRYKV